MCAIDLAGDGSFTKWTGAQHSEPEVRREVEIKKTVLHTIRENLKQQFLALVPHQNQPALILKDNVASDTCSRTVLTDGSSAWKDRLSSQRQMTTDRSVYRSSCASVYNSFSPVGGLPCQLGKSASKG